MEQGASLVTFYGSQSPQFDERVTEDPTVSISTATASIPRQLVLSLVVVLCNSSNAVKRDIPSCYVTFLRFRGSNTVGSKSLPPVPVIRRDEQAKPKTLLASDDRSVDSEREIVSLLPVEFSNRKR